ncbi:MAG: hypothetical protein COU90_00250 [Candidatus Ryanbacteria bacterium CG10_big_fil_rev_8_21_14_0_10_43_42]|uniref:General secretion pathway GspH domain-containing protein n=1 Tax=Candidatus Ryanbacteria bacterium CG10_big_fil_rev_8_21_14_0_10_43_42 TaxID=1974864 RepID=A0A2M8KYH2_9BACT|nr:MAG: hypothetical protein COU90_00250 [Candidatus Ryanbacteria bacterium CG10_big_fil_rev_8_21_14_0_10_43_42]
MNYLKHSSRGFTLTELLVAISIMVILTTVTLANYPRFGRTLAIERDAQLVALALRDAGARAAGTRISASGEFQSLFGVYFDTTPGNNNKYIIFSDINGDQFYTPGIGEELEFVFLSRGVKVDEICRLVKATPPPPEDCAIGSLSITFERPAPTIRVLGVGTSGGPPVNFGSGDFEIRLGVDGDTFRREVIIWTTGAISIEEL